MRVDSSRQVVCSCIVHHFFPERTSMSFSRLTEVSTVTPRDIACRSQDVLRPRVYVS